jgi:uncharacterized membrane protein
MVLKLIKYRIALYATTREQTNVHALTPSQIRTYACVGACAGGRALIGKVGRFQSLSVFKNRLVNWLYYFY